MDRWGVCGQEVYDIAFSRAGGGRDMFASVGADGSVRMFDLRHLEHSTIIYEVRLTSSLYHMTFDLMSRGPPPVVWLSARSYLT